MKRWTRRIALWIAAWWAVLASVSLYSVHLARSTPDWYAAEPISQTDQEMLANQSTQTAADLFSYASDVAAAQRRSFLAGKLGSTAVPEVIGPKTITLSESQLNAFLAQWESFVGGSRGGDHFAGRISMYLTDPRVALRPGRLVVAGMLRNVGMISDTIASVEFDPTLDDHGYLHPGLAHIYSGRLPVPLALLDKPRLSIENALQNAVPDWQLGAGIGPDGLANRDAAAAMAAKVLLAALEGHAADAVVLVPCAVGDMRQTVPLRIVRLEIGDRQITVKIAPLNEQERRGLLQAISE